MTVPVGNINIAAYVAVLNNRAASIIEQQLTLRMQDMHTQKIPQHLKITLVYYAIIKSSIMPSKVLPVCHE